jgi:tetratricopeptide (TPR) repeat protein
MGTESLEDEYDRGVARLREHWLNHAEQAFRHVLAADPTHTGAKQHLGITLFLMQKHDAALELLRDAAAAEPDVLVRRLDHAAALTSLGRAAEAEAEWARAVTLKPELATAPAWARREFSTERGRYQRKIVDYDYQPESRHGRGRGAHAELSALLAERRPIFGQHLAAFAEHAALLADVPAQGRYDTPAPFWLNTWLPPLDAIALTGMLAKHRPKHYLEIGSGMSTKFARRAIDALGLETHIVSVDPQPRSEVDALVGQVIRKPLEQVTASLFEALVPGDILFFDGSHRSFPGSDVTVFFLEILPRLPPGVVVQVHDIYLPDDYVAGHVPRLWNEQYLLACALLYGGRGLEVSFPSWYVSQDPRFAAQIAATLRPGELSELYVHGVSFWLETRARD